MSGRNDERSERLKAALRENLRKRKTQARGRAEPQLDAPSEELQPVPEPRRQDS